ncbi:MAG: hypothetical protein QM495_08520 [Lutibacter sp.]|uniref:hypothetical protein n=1 Tax=Lutibacter sp. TaxID=1925666 RepID=UPI00385C4BD0
MKLRNNTSRILFLILTFIVFKTNAQENKHLKLEGIVKFNSTLLPDINILNKATSLGTSSNLNGTFTIYAKEGDSLLFSSLIYINRIIKISKTHLKSKKVIVYLEPDFNQLDEIMLDKKILLNSINIAVTKGTILDNDKIINNKAPNARNLTDPNAHAGGLNPIALFMMLTKKARLRRKKKKAEIEKLEQQKREFPNFIRNLYKDAFYIEWLQIPNDKINLFLDYCEGNGLNEFYNKDEIIIKNFLVKQAKKFNSINN